jgi:GT2 family glycosyltransferase/SAM-dependent methyltransferase
MMASPESNGAEPAGRDARDREEIRALEEQLAEITNSTAWQVARSLWRLRLWFAPRGSRRDRWVHLTLRAAQVLRRDGARALVWRVRSSLQRRGALHVASASRAPGAASYLAWLEENEPAPAELDRQRQTWQTLTYQPLISVVTPVYNPPPAILRETIESVFAQTYSHWELCLADGQSDRPGVRELLAEYAEKDRRVHVKHLEANQGISANSNAALAMASGEFVMLLDHDDLLAPNHMYEVAAALNRRPEADLLYYDEDKVSEDGRVRSEPLFKPQQWSPEQLLSANYLMHSVIRRALIVQVGGFDPSTDGTQDWDLLLRCVEHTDRIQHIPRVLYHWRQMAGSASADYNAKAWVFEVQTRVVADHLRRRGLDQARAFFAAPGFLRAAWPIRGGRVSIIIPTRDNTQYLRRCLKSILQFTTYPDYEIILVDNDSKAPDTLKYYRQLAAEPRVRIVPLGSSFNYSAANNLGARHAAGEFLLFLNNDVEALESDWLEELVRWAERPEVGAVGAKLLYPDGMVQHAGVVIGMEGHSSHIFWGAAERYSGPFGSVDWYRNYSAVTGACMLMRREVFERAGGFDEGYRLVFSDVEICLRIEALGYRNVYTPFARLRHHEGRSRAQFIPPEDIRRGYAHMRQLVEAGDPHYNPNLSYGGRMPRPASRGEESRAERLRRILFASAGGAAGDEPPPFLEVLLDAGVSGRVLHREDIYGFGPPSPTANDEVLGLILKYAGSPLLDVGCGIGAYLTALEHLGLLARGIEINPLYVAEAQALNRQVQLYEGTKLPFCEGEFDTVMAIEVLEHIPDWELTLAEMLRVARRCVLISVPNIGLLPLLHRHGVVPWHMLEATHVNFFTPEILSTRLSRLPGIRHDVFVYGARQVNGEIYHHHVFVVIHKTQAASEPFQPAARGGSQP